MDEELLMALILLWSSTTTALVVFFLLWFGNEMEAFHPHCVDVDNRHNMFLVVGTATQCKEDFAVKSISAFVAPRGASSSKWFTAIIIIMCIAGMFGCFRWYKVGDADGLEAGLAMGGFGMLILLTAFESDVSSDRFLEDKLLITSWCLEKLGADKLLPFDLAPSSKEYRQFLRQSKNIYYLYDEDHAYCKQGIVPPLLPGWPYHAWWCSLHIFGAVSYVILVPSAVILHDLADESVANAVIAGLSFGIFCLMGYLTGAYMPVIKPLRCIILSWNPFLKDELFLEKLKEAVITYTTKQTFQTETLSSSFANTSLGSVIDDKSGNVRKRGQRKRKNASDTAAVAIAANNTPQKTPKKRNPDHDAPNESSVQGIQNLQKLDIESIFEDNMFLRYARAYPLVYLQIIGHSLVMTEMIAVLTPAVAIGLQWMTALCPGTVSESIIGLLTMAYRCVVHSECYATSDCIMGDVSSIIEVSEAFAILKATS